jgi:hypothetical protein
MPIAVQVRNGDLFDVGVAVEGKGWHELGQPGLAISVAGFVSAVPGGGHRGGRYQSRAHDQAHDHQPACQAQEPLAWSSVHKFRHFDPFLWRLAVTVDATDLAADRERHPCFCRRSLLSFMPQLWRMPLFLAETRSNRKAGSGTADSLPY